MILFSIFVLSLIAQSKQNIVIQDSECEEQDGFLVDNICFVPMFNVSLNYKEAVSACINRGLSLARIRSIDDGLLEFIREKMKPSFLSVFWVDGVLTDTNEVVSKDGSIIDFRSSWRYLYPMKSIYRTHIVLDVWRNITPEKHLVEGFRNTDGRAKYLALCDFSIDKSENLILHDSGKIEQAYLSGSGVESYY